MYSPDLHPSGALTTDALCFLTSFFSLVLALLGAGYLARPRRRPAATAPPVAVDGNDYALKTYLEHHVLC